MGNYRVGILHPGSMGVSLAATVQNSGFEACWASQGRSEETRKRAAAQHLTDLGHPETLLKECGFLVGICPPHAALDMARWTAQHNYQGLYLDANAISPRNSLAIADILSHDGIRYVDGGVIGAPAWQPGTTWLHLSGEHAAEAAGFFSAGPLETNVVGGEIGQASALKMVFAANTKGSTALLCASLAAAGSLGVRDALVQQWRTLKLEPGYEQSVISAGQKAWRFIGEMEEIAETFSTAGLPDGFHRAAAEVYRRLADAREQRGEIADLDTLLRRLAEPRNR